MLVSCTIDIPEGVKKQIEKETSVVFDAHPEYLWYEVAEYRIPLYQWASVEPDLVEKLSEKVSALLFEQKPLVLYSLKYAVKISSHIDVVLLFQEDRRYRSIVESIVGFFSPEVKPVFVPMLPLARYKIPAKQQYTHLKNTLSKMETKIEVPVDTLSLCKTTDFGNGIRKYQELGKIRFDI
jgi:2'-5' RNA ligase